jgi:hypothetical protein
MHSHTSDRSLIRMRPAPLSFLLVQTWQHKRAHTGISQLNFVSDPEHFTRRPGIIESSHSASAEPLDTMVVERPNVSADLIWEIVSKFFHGQRLPFPAEGNEIGD